MNAKKIVEIWLKDNGYDGLCTDSCGCGLSDLMPCSCYCGECNPAHAASVDEIIDAGEDPDEMYGHYWVEGKADSKKGSV